MRKIEHNTGKNSAIPFGDLKREYREIKKEIDQAVKGTLRSGYFVLGENVKIWKLLLLPILEKETTV